MSEPAESPPAGLLDAPTPADVFEAAARIRHAVHRTPVMRSASLDEAFGMRMHFKCENLQRAGAFKARGAMNAVLSLSDEEAARGVVTHSSGNHAQALALAARHRGIPCTVVMPRGSSEVKRRAVLDRGAQVVPCEPTLEARERVAAEVLDATGACFVHPYDDPRVIAGQGTAALELLEDVLGLDALVVPVGGGGLASGTVLAARGLDPGIAVHGAEPACADDACRSLAAGRLLPATGAETIADGLRTALSPRTFAILSAHLAGIATVGEAEIVEAMRRVFERLKVVVEPSGAVALAACARLREELGGRHVGVILSGGNVDLDRLPWSA
jgi:threonine dehydratase